MNLEESSIIVQPLRLASSYSKRAIVSLISKGNGVLGLQNLAFGGKGLPSKSWAKAFANT
jgi:hypothetical protein